MGNPADGNEVRFTVDAGSGVHPDGFEGDPSADFRFNGFGNQLQRTREHVRRHVVKHDAVNAADAVIRELGLQREKNLPLGDERFHQPMHRYVTEWTTDE